MKIEICIPTKKNIYTKSVENLVVNNEGIQHQINVHVVALKSFTVEFFRWYCSILYSSC